MMVFLTSISLDTYISSNRLDPLLCTTGVTVAFFVLTESEMLNTWKERAKFPDLACSFESKLIINENSFVFFFSIIEIKYFSEGHSRVDVSVGLSNVYSLLGVGSIGSRKCWFFWIDLTHLHAQIIIFSFEM